MPTSKPPIKALDRYGIIAYAVGIALREAEIDGLLTKETVLRISDRAEALKNALLDGKVVQMDKNGVATIRDVEPSEEDEFADELQFPHVHKSKTTLDI